MLSLTHRSQFWLQIWSVSESKWMELHATLLPSWVPQLKNDLFAFFFFLLTPSFLEDCWANEISKYFCLKLQWIIKRSMEENNFFSYLKIGLMSPGWCGSVDWASACGPKGPWLDSQSGHMPGLQARSLVGGMWEAATHWCFSPSLSPLLTLCLKMK